MSADREGYTEDFSWAARSARHLYIFPEIVYYYLWFIIITFPPPPPQTFSFRDAKETWPMQNKTNMFVLVDISTKSLAENKKDHNIDNINYTYYTLYM